MTEEPLLASIVVTNHNYARFLREALDSALAQTHPRTEVVVVDDGSTDESPQVIAEFGDRVVSIRQPNAGQDAALNAGFFASRGEVVLFLDSDDRLCPTALEHAIAAFSDPAVVKAHGPLREMDGGGTPTGRLRPSAPLPAGDLKDALFRGGPLGFPWPPTSGNAWRRDFLSRVFPIPETDCVLTDLYLCALAPVYGSIARVATPLGFYRVHADGLSRRGTFEEKVAAGIRRSERSFEAVRAHAKARGIDVDPESWKTGSWWHRIDAAVREIVDAVPAGASFILVNGDQWGNGDEISGRRRRCFVEKDSRYFGPPADDAAAIAELERLRALGARAVVFAWPALWWLDHYSGLREHLEAGWRCVRRNDRAVVFEAGA